MVEAEQYHGRVLFSVDSCNGWLLQGTTAIKPLLNTPRAKQELLFPYQFCLHLILGAPCIQMLVKGSVISQCG